MITEVPNLQRTVKPSEERYTNLIKNEFMKHAKEINRLGSKMDQTNSCVKLGNGDNATYVFSLASDMATIIAKYKGNYGMYVVDIQGGNGITLVSGGTSPLTIQHTENQKTVKIKNNLGTDVAVQIINSGIS